MNVYNRWGIPILQNEAVVSQPAIRWDGHTISGEECADGVYFYIITFETNGEQKTLKGNVTLIR